MTSAAANLALRRGACPGLSAPMPSGDGLLARLRPTGTISLSAFAALCAAARQFGNGVMEITSRGSVQIRGLSASSAPRFADAVRALTIAADDGIPVHSNALAGLDAAEILDAGAVAGELRRTLAPTSLPARLSPKVSVAIDGGGALGLNSLAADVRLSADLANRAAVFHIGVGGDAATAINLGTVASTHSVEAACRLLEVVAQYDRAARARDVLATDGTAPFEAALARLVVAPDHSGSRRRTQASEPIGRHPLRDGSIACGVGLAFGHTNAGALEQLAQTARLTGAVGFRAAPGRVLLAIGIPPADAATFAAAAEQLGFIVHADDARRYVIACAGAPICAAAHIAARNIAPAIADAAAKYVDSNFRIHISGCAKSCAHAGAAGATIVGREDGCAVVADGTVHDAPVALTSAHELPALIAELARVAQRESAHV
jgi:precorrin-3B synthase